VCTGLFRWWWCRFFWWLVLFCVRAGSLCATVLPFLCLWILASGYWWVEFLGMLRCLLWWFVSWGVPFWLVSGVLWTDRFWFEVGSKFVSQVLLGYCDVSSDRPKLEWWSKLNLWSNITIGCLFDHCWRCCFFEELLLGVSTFWGCWWFFFGGFWCFYFLFLVYKLGFNPLISLYIYIYI